MDDHQEKSSTKTHAHTGHKRFKTANSTFADAIFKEVFVKE